MSCLAFQNVMLGVSKCHAWRFKMSCLAFQNVMLGVSKCHAWRFKGLSSKVCKLFFADRFKIFMFTNKEMQQSNTDNCCIFT